MTDLISRADAIEAVCAGWVWYKTASCEEGKEEWECSEVNKIRHLPSHDAVPQLRQTDTLIIADALRYLAKDTERHLVDRTRADALRQQFLKYGASMCKGGDSE